MGSVKNECGMGCCLEENSRIMNIFGHENSIKEIRIGDLIMGRNTNPVRVLNTWAGMEEEPLIKVVTEKDRNLCLTGNHPILVQQNGVEVKIRAAQLQIGDMVWTINGEWEKVTELEKTEANIKVYNLSLQGAYGGEEEHWMYAEGILVGDFDMQEGMGEY